MALIRTAMFFAQHNVCHYGFQLLIISNVLRPNNLVAGDLDGLAFTDANALQTPPCKQASGLEYLISPSFISPSFISPSFILMS
jgi:hypothetical protein